LDWTLKKAPQTPVATNCTAKTANIPRPERTPAVTSFRTGQIDRSKTTQTTMAGASRKPVE
jgi:hypothetical protein